eukprot:3396482-Ditylum_brightwellii.AAC.1
MEQLAAWMDHTWKAMKYCWKKIELKLGEVFTDVVKFSIEAAQEIEHTMILLHIKVIVRDDKGNVSICVLLNTHWPGRGSGFVYNSNSEASYQMRIFVDLL